MERYVDHRIDLVSMTKIRAVEEKKTPYVCGCGQGMYCHSDDEHLLNVKMGEEESVGQCRQHVAPRLREFSDKWLVCHGQGTLIVLRHLCL